MRFPNGLHVLMMILPLWLHTPSYAAEGAASDQSVKLAQIGRRLIQSPYMRQHSKTRTYLFGITQSRSVEAHVDRRNTIHITAGMIDSMDEAELAFVMAHEVAHVQLQHAQPGPLADMPNILLKSVVGGLFKDQARGRAAGSLAGNLSRTAFSRQHESDADHLAVFLIAQAGFDPAAGARAIDKLLRLKQTFEIPFLSTHPAGQDRVAYLTSEAAKYPPAAPSTPSQA